MKGYFVVGTDTGVGKTLVSASLLVKARHKGAIVAAMKPAESGCELRAGRLFAADADFLHRAAGGRQPLSELCPYVFAAPVAPGVAAEQQGLTIDFAHIERLVAGIRSRDPDLLIIEGAGGLLVPMGGGRLLIDLVALIGLPIVVVARGGLGTINHTLLTLKAARARDLEIAGVVLSASESVDPGFVSSNANEIGRHDKAPVWQMPFLKETDLDNLREADLSFTAELFHVEQRGHDGR